MTLDFHQLYLQVVDPMASRGFYEGGLGLEPAELGESSITYDCGGAELKLREDHDAEELAQFGLEPPSPGERGEGAVFVVRTDEPLDAVHERVEATDDGEALTEPRDVEWGGRMFLARDPDGYVVEVRAAE